MNTRSRPFALKPEKESGGERMEGIINMGYGDNTNPWDILKTGWKNLTGSDRKASPAYPAPSAINRHGNQSVCRPIHPEPRHL